MSVSVLMATFNAGEYLEPALISISDQTLRPDQIVLIDDGSTDGSVERLSRSYNGCELTVIRRSNHGLASSLNYGLSLCTSEIVIRMDADDLSEPCRIERQVSYLAANSDVVLVGGQVRRFTNAGPLGVSAFPCDHAKIVEGLLNGAHVLCHPSIAFRREAATSVGGYWSGGVGEDWDFYLKMSGVGKLANLEDRVLDYRFHNTGINADSMVTVRQNIALSILNHERRQSGLREISEREYASNQPLVDRVKVKIIATSLAFYRAGMARESAVSRIAYYSFASVLWPAQAVRRVRAVAVPWVRRRMSLGGDLNVK